MVYNNRLKTIAKFLGTAPKKDHEGWGLWVKVHARNKRAMNEMAAYCKQDVVALEQIFKKLKPLIKGLPIEQSKSGRLICPTCASQKVQSRGLSIKRSSQAQRFQCQKCGTWFQVNKKGVTSK